MYFAKFLSAEYHTAARMSLTLPPSNNIEYNEVPTEEGDDDEDMEDDTVFVQDPTIHLKPLMHPKRRKKTVNQVSR